MDVHEVIIIQQRDQNARAPDLESYNLICRVCLAPCKLDSTNKCKSIHDEEAQMAIRSLIEVYTYVKIPDFEDNLPQNICHKCLEFLIDIHMFRSRCRINEDLLLKIRRRTFDKASFDMGLNTGSKPPQDCLFPDQTQKLINKINDERMGIFRCKDCHIMYDSKKELNAHRNEVKHSRRPASQCPHCGKMFNTTALVQHIRVHTKEKPFSCETCGASFAIKTNLRRHMKIHKNERAYTCEVCGKSYSRSESLAIHLKMHESEKQEKDEAIVTKKSQETYSCSECDKIYATTEQLKIHRRYHLHTFLCPNCGKVFSTKANLVTHSRVHTGERPFVCLVCKKSFTQSSSLRTHQVIHSGDKAFECKICNRRFGVRGNLKAHERIHTGETPHRCAVCQKGFCTSSTLRKHMFKHSKREPSQSSVNDDTDEMQLEQTGTEADQLEEPDYVQVLNDNEQGYDVDDGQEILIADYEEGDVSEEFGSTEVLEEIEVIYDGGEEIVYESDEYKTRGAAVELCIEDESCVMVKANDYKVYKLLSKNN